MEGWKYRRTVDDIMPIKPKFLPSMDHHIQPCTPLGLKSKLLLGFSEWSQITPFFRCFDRLLGAWIINEFLKIWSHKELQLLQLKKSLDEFVDNVQDWAAGNIKDATERKKEKVSTNHRKTFGFYDAL